MATYDLVLKGGHVLDPATDRDGKFDIGIADGVITAIEPELAAVDAANVLEIRGANRYVVPGLIDLHTHVATGATTAGVGMGCCDPDEIGVHAGVTTVVDCGSVGVANIGTFPAHILPKAKTRVIVFTNIGTYAHTVGRRPDVSSWEEINDAMIDACVEANPGLIEGVKLRLVGPVVAAEGPEVVRRTLAVARRIGVPLMVHIGDPSAEAGAVQRFTETTQYLLRNFSEGDILTHLCTPWAGKVIDSAKQLLPELFEARANGVTLDPALGLGNFGYEVAREQAQLGFFPDTVSSDLTLGSITQNSLTECMAKFMAVGYTFANVIEMTTSHAAKALGRADNLGSIQVGREADISVLDLHEGEFTFTDTIKSEFRGNFGIVPVQTVRHGELFAPRWGTHPWGWLPASA